MTRTTADLPYWDGYFRYFRQGDFKYDFRSLHSHYGCWDDPSWSNRKTEHYGYAAERTCHKVCEAAGVAGDQRILDLGCGLGTVVASINSRFSPVELIGLNIDPRQLEIAKRYVQPRAENRIDFVEADGSKLPFADGSFDVVLALECSMHFANRAGFLSEARRVLTLGGRLGMCEHFARSQLRPYPDRPRHSRLWGSFLEPCAVDRYVEMARQAGFNPLYDEDITKKTIPTFPAVRKIFREGMPFPKNYLALAMIVLTEGLMRVGRLRYRIMAFEAV